MNMRMRSVRVNGRVVDVGDGFVTDGRGVYKAPVGHPQSCLDIFAPVACQEGEACRPIARCAQNSAICYGMMLQDPTEIRCSAAVPSIR